MVWFPTTRKGITSQRTGTTVQSQSLLLLKLALQWRVFNQRSLCRTQGNSVLSTTPWKHAVFIRCIRVFLFFIFSMLRPCSWVLPSKKNRDGENISRRWLRGFRSRDRRVSWTVKYFLDVYCSESYTTIVNNSANVSLLWLKLVLSVVHLGC